MIDGENPEVVSIGDIVAGLQWRRHGVDMSTPLLLEVTTEIDTNPTSFYRGDGGSLRLQTPVIGSRSSLAMSVHPTYFVLATPLPACRQRSVMPTAAAAAAAAAVVVCSRVCTAGRQAGVALHCCKEERAQ